MWAAQIVHNLNKLKLLNIGRRSGIQTHVKVKKVTSCWLK